MDIEKLYEFCLSKTGATEHFPFDKDTLVFKVGGKIFALIPLEKWEKGLPVINLKCNPEKAEELRNTYESIEPGWHMSKIHWNTIRANHDVSDNMLLELIEHSYELIFNSLPKKQQYQILQEQK